MEYSEFLDKIGKSIKDYLPEEYKDADIAIRHTEKNNGVQLDSLLIKKPGEMVLPAIHLNEFYTDIPKKGINDVLEEIAELRMQTVTNIPQLEDIKDFSNIKDKITFTVSSYDKQSPEYLAAHPHMRMNNLVMLYQIDCGMTSFSGEKFNGRAVITNEMMQYYKITQEQLHTLAVKNTPILNPPQLLDVEKMAYGIKDEIPLNDGKKLGFGMYTLTNTEQFNGAAAMFYPGVLEQLAEKFGRNYFVIPSSVHEVIVVPEETGIEAEELQNMINAVNPDVAPEEVLSDTLYEYDAKQKILYVVEDFSLVFDSELDNLEKTANDMEKESSILNEMLSKEAVPEPEIDMNEGIEL
mgnify:FL=1